ncbi:hypothetical protein RvY_15300 [Ramazzottius varieornatus]|uniref:Cytochrome b/b6 C-terminal region profile domain-containing protein n=1 Tax=Ramazzottius varieornatus TaxID=947166 RepID=A0A1D1W1B1_RAMVA|nr:hypothetical protein RvY_15300 [Ramazzottius varieornatus]
MFIIINYTFPFSLIDAENFIPANPIVTPVHIRPQYFLFSYAILRAILNKLGGVKALLLSILMLIPLILQPSIKQFNKENQKSMFF